MKKLKAIVLQLDEGRAAPLTTIMSQIGQIDSFDRIVGMHAMVDGFTALFQGKDGKYYEIELRAGEHAKSHDELTGNEKRRQERAARTADSSLRDIIANNQ